MKIYLLSTLLMGMSLLLPAMNSSAQQTPRAPLHLAEMPLHDPYILAHEASRTYYLYTSNIQRMTGVAGVGTMVYKSKDLLNWETPQPVFLVPNSAFAQQGGWAPEVHEYQGRYYLFTTLHNEKRVIKADGQSRGLMLKPRE